MKLNQINGFEDVLSSHEKQIFNHIYRMVGNRHDAEDLTQTTFIKVFDKFNSINESRNLKSWIYTIATNTVIDWMRSRKNKKSLNIISDPDSGFETLDAETPYTKLASKELVYDIHSALQKIKPIYQTVILLFYKEDFSYEEISKMLAIPLNTVKTYIHRAKADLKNLLEPSYG